MPSDPTSHMGLDAGIPRNGAHAVMEPLFSPGERWGWEWRDVNALYSPFAVPPPRAPVPPPHLSPARNRRDPQRRWRRWRTSRWLWAVFVLFLSLLVGGGVGGGKSTEGLVAILGWCIGAAALFARGRSLEHAARETPVPDEWDKEWARMSAAHEAARRAWEEQGRRHHEQEQQRLQALPVWGAVRPHTHHRRIDICGGVPSGWKAIIATLGSSLLGCGERVFVLDLSEEDSASVLFLGAKEARLPTRTQVLPRDLETLDILSGLDAAGIKDVIVEALHADAELADRQARSLDDRILTEVCETLAPRLTFERILAGLRVLLRAEPPPDGARASLTADEWSHLADVFTEDYLTVIAEPLVALESQLSPLRALGRRAAEQSDSVERPVCEGVAIGKEGGALLNELLVDMLVQVTTQRLRAGHPGEAHVVFVVAADRLRRRHLELLDRLAATQDTRLVYLFRHLRDDVLQVAGGTEAVVGVMCIRNPQEAEKAAELIGRGQRFKLTQLAKTVGSTDTTSWGESTTVGESGAWMNWSQNFALGEHRDVAEATMQQEAEMTTLVNDYVLEPEVLKTLPTTALVIAEFYTSDRPRRCRVLDCSPYLGTLPRVSLDPFPESTARLPDG
jgi:hypothetical protein